MNKLSRGILYPKDGAAHCGAIARVDVYEGDIRRAALSRRQRRINNRRMLEWQRRGALGLPPTLRLGRVLNKRLDRKIYANLVVTVGKGLILDRLFGLSAVGAMTRLGVGTSATAAALGDTTLTGGVFQAYDSTPTRSGTAVTCVVTFGTGAANINWQEMGMDNGTTLLNRIAPIGPFNKTTAVSIVVTLTFTQN